MSSILKSTADTAHAAVASLFAAAEIAPGGVIPATAEVKEDNPTKSFTLGNLSGRNVIIGVPAAFSPTCSDQVPGYVENYEKFKAKGINDIYVVAVNDVFVMKAWKAKLASDSPIHFIADDRGLFSSAVGLIFDASPLLGGPRSKRYVLVVDDGKVTHLGVEPNPSEVTLTSADTILAFL